MMGSGPLASTPTSRKPVRPTPTEPIPDRELLDRFVASRNGDAFAELVHRHGPMVLRVCRRVLRDREDAQDAFQVSFLVLARKAGSLAHSELLANWLYGVAYRTAVHMRGRAARRLDRERQVVDMPAPLIDDPTEKREVLAVLDEELNQLPEAYRSLVVLCYLEGKTHQEAARELSCPVGSIASRVARAREMLHRRLCRRGVVLPAGLFAVLLTEQTAGADVPDELVFTTTWAAVDYAGPGASTSVSADHAALTEEVIDNFPEPAHRRRTWFLLLVLLLSLLSAGTLFAAVPEARIWMAPPAESTAVVPYPHSGNDAALPGTGCSGKGHQSGK